MKLTDVEWRKVFDLRCNSKRGSRLSEIDQALCERAYAEDPKRYGAMNADVFNETVPAGSNARYKARNAETTASGRIVRPADADRDLRKMVQRIPRPPKG